MTSEGKNKTKQNREAKRQLKHKVIMISVYWVLFPIVQHICIPFGATVGSNQEIKIFVILNKRDAIFRAFLRF